MTILERIKAQYELNLKANWNPDGTRQPRLGRKDRAMMDTLRLQIERTQQPSEAYLQAIAMSRSDYALLGAVERRIREGMDPVDAVDSVLGPMRPIPFVLTPNKEEEPR